MAVSPQENFYQWVNNEWLQDESIKIPDDYPRWGSFIKLADEALKKQITILSDLSSDPECDTQFSGLGTVWRASMKRFEDWEAGKGSYTSIQKEVNQMEKHLDQDDLAGYVARCQRIGIGVPLDVGVLSNFEDSQNMVLSLSGGDLSLPTRDHYFDSKYEEQRNWFRAHLGNVAKLLDMEEKSFSDAILKFETRVAYITMSPSQARNYDKYYSLTTLNDLVPSLDSLNYFEGKMGNYDDSTIQEMINSESESNQSWLQKEYKLSDSKDSAEKFDKFLQRMYEALGIETAMKENFEKTASSVSAPKAPFNGLLLFDADFVKRVYSLLTYSLADTKAYLTYQIIKSASSFTTKELNEEFFDFYSRKLKGQKEQKSAEKRSVNLTNAWLGELLGKLYVEKFFSAKDKETVKALIGDVLDVMKVSLQTNDWLTAETKQKALQKLSKFVVKIGYPDKWKDFSLLQLSDQDDLYTMNQKVKAFNFQTEFLEKINTPKDKTKWEMNPQTVNAYFHPLNNEIVFPAAILQPPFYQKALENADFDMTDISEANESKLLDAVNFGGIGAVIAHEITHGYDDQGRKFDAEGNINDWWESEDVKLFEAKTELMAQQAEKYVFVHNETKHVLNAKLTMGENLADLGGLSLACQAFLRRHSVEKGNCGKEESLKAFFKSWANVWKTKATEQFLITQIASDPHSPTPFRANLVSNIDCFYDVFNVRPEDPMYVAPEQRVVMW